MSGIPKLISHNVREIDELRSDPALASAYLMVAKESLGHPSTRRAGVLALRALVEACGARELVGRPGIDDEFFQQLLSDEADFDPEALLTIQRTIEEMSVSPELARKVR